MKLIPSAYVRKVLCILLGITGLFCTGCAPSSEQEREFFRELEKSKTHGKHLTQTFRDGSKVKEAIELAQQAPVPDGDQNMLEWLNETIRNRGGSIMFPRWTAIARGANQYEVEYTYTFLGRDYRAVKKGFLWNVDLLERRVGLPHELTDEELAKRQPTYTHRQAEQRKPGGLINLE